MASLAVVLAVSCEKVEPNVGNPDGKDKTDPNKEPDDPYGWCADEFNALSSVYDFFDAKGGVMTVTAGSDILFHCVRVYTSSKGFETLLERDGLYIDSRPVTYPAVFETACCTVVLIDARTIEITLLPYDKERTTLVTVSGIKDDGTFLSPRDIILYQNF